ncbi:MAG: putative hemolysin [Patiriisocius sp.]|jgi:putative hemolysin
MDYYFIIIILSLICSALFSGTEIAFISSNQLQIELGKKQGNLADSILSWFNKRRPTFIAAMLVGNNIALVAYAYFMSKVLDPRIEAVWDNLVFVLLAQTFISSIIVLFFAEFLPKTIFRINPNKTLHLFLLPVVLCYFILLIPALLISSLSEFIIRAFLNGEKEERETVLGRIDLNNYFDEMELDQLDDEEVENEVQIFQNALDFSKTKAREIMIPRNEVVALDIDGDLEELKKNFISSGLSKILIYKEKIDNIIGYVHNRELFKNPESIKSILLPLAIMPESKTASDILKQFIKQKQNLAVVVDEYGGTAGILTIEDVVEEIFGEIQDEHDTEQLIERQLSENSFLFSARHEIDMLCDKYKLPLEESEEYDTLAGLVLHHSEDIPEKNEKIILENVVLEVIEVSINKIELLKLTIKQ